MAGLVPADTLKDYIGKDMGASDWLKVDQERINQFADATNDHQFIHIDSEKATPLFGVNNSAWILIPLFDGWIACSSGCSRGYDHGF